MEIDILIQMRVEFWCVRFQFMAIRLNIWAGIANAVLIFHAYTEAVILERHQIANIAFTVANASAHGDPVAFGQFKLFDLKSETVLSDSLKRSGT